MSDRYARFSDASMFQFADSQPDKSAGLLTVALCRDAVHADAALGARAMAMATEEQPQTRRPKLITGQDDRYARAPSPRALSALFHCTHGS